jgi:APA family basic amino acid/polyamine antiporter
MEPAQRESIPARLGLWDATSIILGIIIGVGIFATPYRVFQKTPTPMWGLSVWLIGGMLALAGALCFAELAAAYPRSGGEYVYLTRAFGPMTGYLFAWAQLTVIRPGSIGAVAFVFAANGAALWGLGDGMIVWLAGAAVLLLTVVNILGVTLGKTTQNFLTLAKVLGLLAIVAAGFALRKPPDADPEGSLAMLAHLAVEPGWFATSMILVLWTYAGWQEAGYVATEVRQPTRNIPRAVIFGTLAVTLIYLLINGAIWHSLGESGAKAESAVSDVIANVFPAYGPDLLRILIMISALGAVNGMIFTTARIYSEFGADHRLFEPLSRWSQRMGTPVRALVAQGGISLGLILGIGLIWNGNDAFEKTLDATAAVFWVFFALAGASLFVLRRKEPDVPRPFRVPVYPLLPLLFCASCLYMVYGAVRYEPKLSVFSLLLLVVGLPFYFWPKKRRRQTQVEEPQPIAQA